MTRNVTGKRISIIDHDLDFQKAMLTVISRFGFLPMVTSNSETFLQTSKEERPDLYLIDLENPDMKSGLSLVKALRLEIDPETPIIVVSKSSEAQSIEDALDAGATDYLVKPFDKRFIASKLSSYLESTELEEFTLPKMTPTLGEIGAKLTFNCEATEINELGITFESKHMIPKGTVIKISGAFIGDLGNTNDPPLVTVASTSLDPKTQVYEVFAEFGNSNQEFIRSVRQWLSRPSRLSN